MVEVEKKAQEPTSEGLGEGNNNKASPLIESANSAAERLEKATFALKIENDRRENLVARERLGGTTSGIPHTPKTEEISPAEYAKNALMGKIIKPEKY